MKDERYIVGIDGGGTKTACIMASTDGSRVAFSAAGGSNHQIDGLYPSMENVCLAIRDACEQLGVTREQIDFVYLGLAGADLPEDFELLRGGLRGVLGDIPFEVVNDCWIAFACASEANWGAVSICGTGSNMAVMTRDGTTHSLRALRYMLGNYGGGHHLASMALHRAFRCDEGTGKPTRLTAELPAFCNCASMDELAQRTYQSGYRYPKDFNIPKLVFDLAAEGDEVSLGLIRRMGTEVGEMLGRLLARVGLADEAVPVVLCGSQYVKDERGFLRESMIRTLHAFVPDARVWLAQSPPVYGALTRAFASVGKRLPEPVMQSLRERAEEAFQ